MAAIVRIRDPGYASGSFTATFNAENHVAGSYQETYIATGLLAGSTPYEVMGLTAGRIPEMRLPGSVCSNPYWCVGRVDIKQLPKAEGVQSGAWEITLNYEPNPLLLPLEIHRYTSHYSETLYLDFGNCNIQDGTRTGDFTRRPILNSAKQRPSRAVERNIGTERIEIIQRLTKEQAAKINPDEYVHHQNSAVYMGKAIGTLALMDFRCPWVWNPLGHCLCTFVYEYKPLGWTVEMLNEGSKCLKYNDTTHTDQLAFVVTDTGDKGGSALLDADGRQLPKDGTPTYSHYEKLPWADFNNLGIFNNYTGGGQSPYGAIPYVLSPGQL